MKKTKELLKKINEDKMNYLVLSLPITTILGGMLLFLFNKVDKPPFLLMIFSVVMTVFCYVLLYPKFFNKFKIINLLSKTFYLSPIYTFLCGVYISDLYFKDNNYITLTSTMIMLIIFSISFIVIYSHDIALHFMSQKYSYVIILLVYEIIHIIYLFALIYLCIFLIDNKSFLGIDTTNSFTIFLDFSYFSTITFTTLGYGDILPKAPASKLIVMIEVLFFAIFISIIVCNIISGKKNEKDQNETDKNSDN